MQTVRVLQPHRKGFKSRNRTLMASLKLTGGAKMYAIIETGGKQIKVEKDSLIYVEKLDAAEGDTVVFDKVLFADGKIGHPFIEGAKVTGVVEKQGKGKKITIIKYKPKKSSTRRKQGHRQPYTCIKIESIEA